MATDPSSLSGMFKEAYGDEVINLIPEAVKLQKAVDFVPSDKEEGNYYNQPVIVQQEHGFTYAAAGAGAFAVNSSVSMVTQNAKVQGTCLLLESVLSYDAAAKASNGKKAFMKATELLVQNMVESMAKRLEIMFLYGGSGLGTGSARSNVDTTHTRITITTANFAAGIWAGLKGAKLDWYQTDKTTKINATLPYTIDKVDIDNKYLYLSNTNTTDLAALDTYVNANPDANHAYFFGANGAECAGVDKIITNAGTLFNIDAATYIDTWKGVSYSAGTGALTFGKLIRGLAGNVARGLQEGVDVYVNPLTWTNLNDDLAALRMLGTNEKGQYALGSEDISYYSQAGKLTVHPHIFVKEGEAFAMPLKRCLRPGATDVTFKTPGMGDQIFFHDPSVAGFRYRVFSEQAWFIETPAWCLKITNIVNS